MEKPTMRLMLMLLFCKEIGESQFGSQHGFRIARQHSVHCCLMRETTVDLPDL
jgi:hypothetical protein